MAWMGLRTANGGSRILRAAAILLVASGAAAAASAASFRPLDRLPPIPVEVDNENERALLQADLERLRDRAADIEQRRRLQDRDCGGALFAGRQQSGGTTQRDCQFRLVDLRRDASRFNADVHVLEAHFRRVASEIAARRTNGHATAVAAVPVPADRRLGFVREALAADGASWQASLAQVRALFATRTGDASLRDAVAYLEAMQRGAIAAADLENGYYRHGVRRYLAGDDWSAALAFAQAARDDPGDPRIFDSFARTVRRQHHGPECVKAGRCVGGDLAAWAARFGAGQTAAAKALLAAAGRDGADAALRDAVKRLRGFAVYGARVDPAAPIPPDATAHAAAAAGHVRASDWTAAAGSWTEALRLADPERAEPFLAIYGGRGPVPAGTAEFAALRAALARADADPFSGALTTAQIIRLQR